MNTAKSNPGGQLVTVPAWTIAAAIGGAVFTVVIASLVTIHLTRSIYTEAFEAGFYRGQASPGSQRPQRKLVTDRLPQTPLPSNPPNPMVKP